MHKARGEWVKKLYFWKHWSKKPTKKLLLWRVNWKVCANRHHRNQLRSSAWGEPSVGEMASTLGSASWRSVGWLDQWPCIWQCALISSPLPISCWWASNKGRSSTRSLVLPFLLCPFRHFSPFSIFGLLFTRTARYNASLPITWLSLPLHDYL